MSAPVTRDEACAAARRVLDAALDRLARDLAAGRLGPEADLAIRRAERRRAARTAPRHADAA